MLISSCKNGREWFSGFLAFAASLQCKGLLLASTVAERGEADERVAKLAVAQGDAQASVLLRCAPSYIPPPQPQPKAASPSPRPLSLPAG
jgi:hypothetical protein